jgi:hypothetical protein
MKKNLLATLLLCFATTIVIAQEAVIKVTNKYTDNRSVTLNFEKQDPGTHTLVINFKQLTNTTGAMQQSFTLSNYSGNIVTLTPSNKDQSVGLSYSYSYIRGKLKPRFISDFLYTLPYKSGVKVTASESGFIGSMYFGNVTPEDWKVYRFYTKQEDTVIAVRKGLVVDIKDLYETSNSANIAYTNKINEITIEHEDGTLATYRGIKKGSVKVKVGQTVFPATTLGLNILQGSTNQFSISLLITYLNSIEFQDPKNQTVKNSNSLYGFITPHFYTLESNNAILKNNQIYTSVQTPEIINKEMTKRELKNFGVKK